MTERLTRRGFIRLTTAAALLGVSLELLEACQAPVPPAASQPPGRR